MNPGYTAQRSLDVAVATASATPVPSIAGEKVTPDDVRQFLARLRLLDGVPFAYLVPDSDLLPPESIRFFYLDRGWTDALVQGALSVGTVSTADRAQLEAVYGHIHAEVDVEERHVRLPGQEATLDGPAGTVTGFLLRSRAVSGWPGLHVRGYRAEPATRDDEIVPESHPDRLKVLRMERLAPAVLLVLFDGVPEVVYVEEPRSGIQFGVHVEPVGTSGSYRATTTPRDARTGDVVAPPRDVPFRPNAPGVIDIAGLAKDLLTLPDTNMRDRDPDTPDVVDSAEFAVEMLRFPFRQVFGNPRVAPNPLYELFVSSVDLDLLQETYEEVLGP